MDADRGVDGRGRGWEYFVASICSIARSHRTSVARSSLQELCDLHDDLLLVIYAQLESDELAAMSMTSQVCM